MPRGRARRARRGCAATRARPTRWRRGAERCARASNEPFWCETSAPTRWRSTATSEPCRVRTSNAGHCLFAGIAAPERARACRRDAHGRRRRSRAGGSARSRPAKRRYNPMSYHNGSIWPHDNALVAAGLARYGFDDGAARILDAMFDLSGAVDLHRLPELFCGFHRRDGDGPTLYPVACAPQAWAAGAVYLLLRRVLACASTPPGTRWCSTGRGCPRRWNGSASRTWPLATVAWTSC